MKKLISLFCLFSLFVANAQVFRSEGGGYVSAPSDSLKGVAPEANWIWDSGQANPYNHYLYVRKSFDLSAAPQKATAYISAYAFAELYINGEHIDRVPTNPDPEFQTYEEIDLTPYLQKGENTIAALVYNVGQGLHHRLDARGGFFFQASITDSSGETIQINSDKTWRVKPSKEWDPTEKLRQSHLCIGIREKYDARRSLNDWQEISYDDSGWESATEIGVPPLEPWNNIVVVKRERLFYEVLEPVKSWETNGYVVYDFGKEITAFPRFNITAEKEDEELIIGTSEKLDENKFPMMKVNVDFTDSYLTKKGEQSWQPMTWRAFRYFAIQKNPAVKINTVSAQFRSFPVEQAGSFLCSDKLLNEIWEIGRWTLQICAHDTWMDTPWREQTQYIAGDTRYNMHYSVFAFAPAIKLLNDYNILSGAFSQRHSELGAIRARYPTDSNIGANATVYIPDYQLEWILMLKEHYMYYNDAALVKTVYPNLKILLQYFEKYISQERGLLGQVPGRIILDHPDTTLKDVSGENTAMNAIYFGALNSAAWLAENVVDDPDQAKEWNVQAEKIKVAAQKYLWSQADNVFKDGFKNSGKTQQTQVYAAKYGLVPDEKIEAVANYAVKQGRAAQQSFSYWVLNTLAKEGHGQWALDYIRTNWGHQMRQDGFNGSWFEMWGLGRNTSASHAWSSGPTAQLPQMIFGVEPLEPGWKKFSIKPALYDLAWAEGTIPSTAGNIDIRLLKLTKNKQEIEIKMELTVPEKTTAKVYIPVHSSESEISVNKEKLWTDKKYIGVNNSISFIAESNSFVVIECSAGTYSIISK